ncbi:MAG: hypothetical protein ACC618_02990 [Patescibacteria group bacterium]
MTRIVIKKLIWDSWNSAHIRKRGLSINDVEEAARNMVAHKRARSGRYITIGRSGRRIISIVVNRLNTGVYYVVTARDSDKKERRIVYQYEKEKK